MESTGQSGQPKGCFFFAVVLVVLGLLGFAYYRSTQTTTPTTTTPGQVNPSKGGPAPASSTLQLAETKAEVPALGAAAAYQPTGDVYEMELSEYAGYAGLIVANGGLESSPDSILAKKGLKLKIRISEEESWSALNSGKFMASATTADVLAAYGKQFNVVVPAQIGFSRGADGIVVRKEYKRVNALKGKVLVTSQFTEADFFIRYLAQEASIGVNALQDLSGNPDPDKINLVYAADAFAAGDVFLSDVTSGGNRLAGCVTWDPKTTEVVQASGGKAHVLTTNKNLLIIADILIVNKAFAQQNADKVKTLIHGLLEGNQLVRDTPDAHLDTVAKAFKWDREKARRELAKVHFSNLPESKAFFSGAIDAAGSFGGIFQSAVYAYGSLIKNVSDSERFLDLNALKAIEESGAFKDQKIAIAPIRSGSGASVENDPLLSRDIRFLFQPNSSDLDLKNNENLQNLEAISKLLKVSPGSTILLRGHVDNAQIDQFRKNGGEPLVRSMALKAVELSKNRANEIKRLIVERHKSEATRLETIGRGWDEPAGADSEKNRRVEVQWFMVE